jgi:acyl-CoA thioester hydrolase
MAHYVHEILLRVRYSETDQMGTYYNSRPLEWFECARSELLRSLGKPYTEVEREGFLMPVREAHVEYLGKASYDDLLRVRSVLSMPGRARIRVDVEITKADSGEPVCRGYTIHAVTNVSGKPVRPPAWLAGLLTTRTE